jgi:ParB family chromosome partitioning protein
VWHLHDRLEEDINDDTCRAEIESFRKHGQLIPAIGRRTAVSDDYDIELICGARRLFVARHIKQPLLVELHDFTDREALVAMDLENRQRKDISPYERGLSFARWLSSGHFESQDDIVRALRISASQVSRLLKFARLPAVVVDAFDSPASICEIWGLQLATALENPDFRQAIVSVARSIVAGGEPRPPAAEVYRRLLAAMSGRKPRKLSRDKIVKSVDGSPLFRVRQQSLAIALLLPMDRVSATQLASIEAAVAAILQK